MPSTATDRDPDVDHDARRPRLLSLHDPLAARREVVGGKAAALSQATGAGCRVADGFVLTVHGVRAVERGGFGAVEAEMAASWEHVGGGPLVVRSSSVIEDSDEESMAGRYETVADVTTMVQLRRAVRTVMRSRSAVADGAEDVAEDHPIAVLIQVQMQPALAGVAFGIEPATGRPDRRVVAAVEGVPEGLVSGTDQGDTWVTDPTGDPVSGPSTPTTSTDRRHLLAIVDMVDRLGEHFGEPQDIEWAIDEDDALWLLQSRPITTDITAVPSGPLLGTGPIAETFPDGLSALEEDLWVPPLRDGIVEALRLSAVAGPRQIDASPVLVTLQGRPAVDLHLLGRADGGGAGGIRGRVRRIMASWRLGRLRAALPEIGTRLAERVDRDLQRIRPPSTYGDEQLLAMLDRCGRGLRALHGHEILMGLITDRDADTVTGNGVALRLLGDARRRGLDDDEAILEEPAILTLLPPRIGPRAALPETTTVPPRPDPIDDASEPGVVREALRMRVRWLHELTSAAALEIGRRLQDRGLLTSAGEVRHVRREDLDVALRSGERPELQPPPAGDALPSVFRLGPDEQPVREPDDDGGEGTGAGGGQADGAVHVLAADDDLDAVPEGAVLVVGELRPNLAGVLGRIEALVAETGSPLSHMAILAREAGVATVVNVADARGRFAETERLRVDGGAGTVEEVAA